MAHTVEKGAEMRYESRSGLYTYRIFSPSGEHVATVRPEHVQETLDYYNGRRELDIDGNPIGVYRAEPYTGFIQGEA